jgi:hypothetical protein
LAQQVRAAYQLLETEAWAMARLHERYRNPYGYPPGLARLVGYDLDAREPFVLVQPPRGKRLAESPGFLRADAVRRFEASLLRGVLAMTSAEVVHGGLRPETVCWDGESVQITTYETAAAVGEVCAGQTGRWVAPEQRSEAHRADPADDVWGAAAMIYNVVTGLPFPEGGVPRLTSRGEALRGLLDGVFNASAANRPDVSVLLRRLRAEASAPPGHPLHGPGFDEGGQAFEETLARKRAGVAKPMPPSQPEPPHPRRRFRLW